MFRLYLRGQFCAHRNAPEVNGLWAQCPHLGSGLVRELETKHAIVRKLQQEGKGGRTRFISAEGCYSWVVANAPVLLLNLLCWCFGIPLSMLLLTHTFFACTSTTTYEWLKLEKLEYMQASK